MTIITPRCPTGLCLLVGALLCVVAEPIGAASPTADGWQKLWANGRSEARTAFQTALRQNRADAAALRGLGLLDLQEGAESAALQAWRSACVLSPSHWGAAAYWPRIVELAARTGRWKPLEEVARALLSARETPPWLRASARLALADAADRAGRTAEAQRLRTALGHMRLWRVVGPFDNVSRSGFGRAHPPEGGIRLWQTHRGRYDISLRWHLLALVSREGQCAVAASLGGQDPGVFYAATAIFSRRGGPAVLWLDTCGASALALNGVLVFTDPIYRTSVPLVADAFRVPVTLRSGWNTLLVKLADDGQTRAAFSLRVTDPTGTELSGLRADPAHATGSAPMANRQRSPAEPEAVAFLRQEAPPGDPEAAAAIAYYLAGWGDYAGATRALRTALQRAPRSGWLHWELSQVLEADGQPDEARAERDLALRQNPGLVAAALRALEDGRNATSLAERTRRLKEMMSAHPASADVRWALSDAYGEARLPGEAIKAARAAVAVAAGPDEVERLVSLCMTYGRHRDAEDALALGLRVTPNAVPLLRARARLLAAQGKTAAALADYQRLLRLDVTQPWHYATLAGLHAQSRRLWSAARALQELRRLCPQDAEACARLGDVLLESGRRSEALTAYREAVRLDPSQVEVREKARLLAGEQPVMDLAPATDAGPVLASAAAAKALPGASELVLLDEGRTVVYPDYATITRIRHIIKVLDAAAVGRYQSYPLAVTSASARATVERARIIKPDGKVQDVAEGADEGTVPLPSLAVGDVIDIAHRVEDWHRGGLARHFWGEWFFTTPSAHVKVSRYVLLSPPGMPLQVRAHGGAPEPRVRDQNGWRIREWRVADAAPRKQSVLGVALRDSGVWIDLSTVPSWAHVARWYRNLAQLRCVPDERVRARAMELTRDARSDEERINALCRFVARDIQYQTTPFRMSAYIPTEGARVLAERYGDCKDKAALLAALLSAVGIRCDMVLLSPRSQGIVPYLPSPRFTHAVARVATPSGPLWVDPTADQMAFGGFPLECQGVPALVISEETTGLVETPSLPVEWNRIVDTHECALSADGRLTGTMALSASGNWAWALRSVLGTALEANRDDVLRRVISRGVDGARFDSGSVEALNDADRPLVIQVRYHVERYGSPAGAFLVVPLPGDRGKDETVDALLSDPSQQPDLETALMRGHYVSSLRFELPPGYAPQELQPEVRGESAWGSYRTTYRMEGRTLRVERDVRMTPLRVPAREVPGYLEFLRAVHQEARRQLVLKK